MSDLTLFSETGHLVPNDPHRPECPEGVPTDFPHETGRPDSVPSQLGEVSRVSPSVRRDTGHPTISGRLGRRAQLSTHRCGATILIGLDNEPCGLTAWVDPLPLSAIGEVAAIVDNRRTYRYRWGSLDPRDTWNIPGHPAGIDTTVLAEHRCGDPVPDGWLAPEPPEPTTPPDLEEPGF